MSVSFCSHFIRFASHAYDVMNALISKMLFADDRIERPPGPGPLETVQFHVDFVRDQIESFRKLDEQYGPISRSRFGSLEFYLVTDPEAIEEVLLRNARSFHKDAISQDVRHLVGNGLIISEGEKWRRQRKLIAPNLQPRHLESYAEVMVDQTRRTVDTWEDGEVIQLDRDMMEITLRVVVQTLFDLDLEHRVATIGEAIDDAMAYLDEITHSFWRFAPESVPTPLQRRFERARENLNELIYDLIEARRRRDEPGDDLLYRLIDATDEEGDQMTDRQLRDELITMFVAGHETTALAMTYAWWLMTEHPETLERARAEVDEVIGDRRPGLEDVEALPYVDAVVKEAMRLYPPAWVIGREAIEDVEIGEYTVPEGAQVLLPQCLIHRKAEYFDEPEAFRPERWLDGLEDELPRYAYFPFGGGPRICIGNHFANMESILVTATILQRAELTNVTDRPLETYTSVTQRPTHPIEMRVATR